MTLAESILSKRELTVFIGVENHSTPFNPFLFNKIWNIPQTESSKELLIIPINGLGESFMLSKKREMCYGRSLWILFVDSPYFSHNAFLFDTFPQTDENNYFNSDCIDFLQKANCKVVSICDMGIYKSRSLVNLLNSALSSLGKHSISICLSIILGYNSRGYTDVEIGDESSIYQKEFYLHSDIDVSVMNDRFYFIQIDRKFSMSELFLICSQTKSYAESKLQQIKEAAQPYNTLKTLWDYGFFHKTIESLNKSDTFDFVSLEKNLSKMGFNGDLIDCSWTSTYQRLCRDIRMSNQNMRSKYIKKLIFAIGKNINSTINFVKSI